MIKNKIIPLLIIPIFLCCSYPIKHKNLILYPKKETRYCIIYSQYPVNHSISSDFDNIYVNLSRYLSDSLGMNIQYGKVSVGILPIDNNVCDFSKRGTSTFSYINRRIIYLLDIDHLPGNIIEKYGNAPIDYYQNAYTHELTHILTIAKNRFSNSLKMKERIANFCSFLDFRKGNISVSEETRKSLHDNIIESFNDKKIEDIENNSLKALESDNSWEIPIFMLYLFENNDIIKLQQIVKSKNMDDFIKTSNWNITNTNAFITWIKSK